MDRENQAAPCCRCLPKNTHNFSGLPQIEPIKGFIHDENGLRREHAERYQHTAPVAFRQMRNARLHHRPQTQSPDGSHLSLFLASEEAAKHSEQLADTLRWIGRHGFGDVEQDVFALGWCKQRSAPGDRPGIRGQQTA